MVGLTSIAIQPRSTPGQVFAISTASSMVSVSSTEYPPRASLVSMNGPSVTPLARIVLAVAGAASERALALAGNPAERELLARRLSF